jgi:hypothetical protein
MLIIQLWRRAAQTCGLFRFGCHFQPRAIRRRIENSALVLPNGLKFQSQNSRALHGVRRVKQALGPRAIDIGAGAGKGSGVQGVNCLPTINLEVALWFLPCLSGWLPQRGILLPMAICASIGGMWAKWTNFYNRAKSANAALSLFERAWQLCAIIFGSAVLAWASRTWDWYWNTFSWAGVAFAFLVSWIGIALASFLGGLGMYLWRNNLRGALNSHAQGRKILKEKSKTYVGEINIAVGIPPSTEPVLLIGYATCNEARLRIIVEHSYLAVALGFVGWRTRTSVELDDLRDLFIGQKIMIHIVTASPHGEPPKLMWGSYDGPLINSIQKGRYRARIRFIGINGEQAPAYFLLTALGNGDPNLISVTLDCDFAFISEWEN